MADQVKEDLKRLTEGLCDQATIEQLSRSGKSAQWEREEPRRARTEMAGAKKPGEGDQAKEVNDTKKDGKVKETDQTKKMDDTVKAADAEGVKEGTKVDQAQKSKDVTAADQPVRKKTTAHDEAATGGAGESSCGEDKGDGK